MLSLFFIDEVVKYRDYAQPDEKGEYARVFEAEYATLKDEYLSELALDNEAYRKYLSGIDAAKTHNGYFAIDKKTNRLKDPVVGARAVDSDDVDAYDLILKDKVWVGASYRTGDALVASLEVLPTHQWRLGYAYDIGLSSLMPHHRGSHELMVQYEFGYRIRVKDPRYF